MKRMRRETVILLNRESGKEPNKAKCSPSNAKAACARCEPKEYASWSAKHKAT